MLLIITGGSGSLGKAIIKQQDILKANGITKIRVLSRDEQKQVSLLRNYQGSIRLDCFLADVSDRERMLFGMKGADYVIHAAAQKHIDKFELDVPVGFKTNILGTQNVAEGFLQSANAKSAILVSTDKAVSPSSSYGVSKLAAQKLWLWNNRIQPEAAFGVALYGNVLGSNGSVLDIWTNKSLSSLPLPITDFQCTRFFITLPNAAKFVLQSLFQNEKKVHIPEMKSAYMVDVARTVWDYWRKEQSDLLKFDVIGVRGSEKLHEVLTEEGFSSEFAPKFTSEELKEMYQQWAFEQCSR